MNPSDAASALDGPSHRGDFLGSARSHIAEREYWASRTEIGLQAPNRAQNLRSYFDSKGVVVHDRIAEGSPKLVELRLREIGRGDATTPVSSGEVVAAESRVEIRRDAVGIVEWFENSAAGLEQGFTLASRPAGAPGVGNLVLELAVGGARASLDGDAVTLATDSGWRLSYGKLSVVDAKGATLVSRFEVSKADRIRLIVDDAGATYPIVIDPLLARTSDAAIRANQAEAQLGYSVASAGDVNGDGFDDIVVGAPLYDAGQQDEGAAFVFLGSPSGITPATADPLVAHARIEANQAFAALGKSVASAGDVNGDGYDDVIVGAPSYSNGQSQEGSAFVFLGSSSGIADGTPGTAHARLESDVADARFGEGVASAGDVNGDGYGDVIVGAPQHPFPELLFSPAGGAFVFLGSAAGLAHGTPATAHAAFSGVPFQVGFGSAVASAGDVDGDGFGDVVVVHPFYGDGQSFEGASFLYRGSATGLTSGSYQSAATRIESNQTNGFLASAAGAGDVNGDGFGDLIVGAYGYGNGQNAEGGAFLFHGSAAGIASGGVATAASRIESDQAGSGFGAAVAPAGDVDGDGYSDVVVGAAGWDVGASSTSNEGAFFVFSGSATGLATGAAFALATAMDTGDLPLSAVGTSVAGAGDVNGDGTSDVIVGATSTSLPSSEGFAGVYHGGRRFFGSGTPELVSDVLIDLNRPTFEGGVVVSGAGDVNGDGYADVMIGAPEYDGGETDEGAVFVFLGSGALPAVLSPAAAHVVIESNQASARFGGSLAAAGDVNGDGFGDVVIGAEFYSAGQVEEGAAFVFLGSPGGIVGASATAAHARLESNQIGARLGYTVDSAGDVNGDGYADVVVGASYYDGSAVDEGRAFVFHGSPSGIGNGHPGTAQGQAARGHRVSSAGDVNGDGYGDIVLSGPAFFLDGVNDIFDHALIYLGSPAGIGIGPSTTFGGLISVPKSFDSAGDVNGDGFGDVIASRWGIADVVVLHGSPSGISPDGTPNAILNPGLELAVSGLGDVGGDGYDDVSISYSASVFDEWIASAAVFQGSTTGIPAGSEAYSIVRHSDVPVSSNSGLILLLREAAAGDVDGDGFGDLILGSSVTGDAYLLLTSSGGRQTVSQRRADGSNLRVAPGGRSENPDSFKVSLLSRPPHASGRIRAEVEVCANGLAFGSASCSKTSSPAWIPVGIGTPEIELETSVTGLMQGTSYRWRARILRAPAIGPIPANPGHGPWLRLAGNVSGGDIRIVPEPGLAIALGVGVAAAGVFSRRRIGRRNG